nr:hypothetical protein OG461_01895 [Streptomyces sp. NBC_00995]
MPEKLLIPRADRTRAVQATVHELPAAGFGLIRRGAMARTGTGCGPSCCRRAGQDAQAGRVPGIQEAARGSALSAVSRGQAPTAA